MIWSTEHFSRVSTFRGRTTPALLSAGEIAKRCAVSDRFVDGLKTELHTSNIRSMDTAPAVEASAVEQEKTVTYTHPKSGKPTQMKTNNIGKPTRDPSS
jgi:hypothetical protein